jgi:hypothetical protein
VYSSDAGTYGYELGYESAIVRCCTVTHRLVDALWPSRGAACQSTMPHLPVIMQGELSMAGWQGGIPVEDSSRAMVSVLDSNILMLFFCPYICIRLIQR